MEKLLHYLVGTMVILLSEKKQSQGDKDTFRDKGKKFKLSLKKISSSQHPKERNGKKGSSFLLFPKEASLLLSAFFSSL